MFPVISVPDDAADLLEQLGTKRKFWFTNSAGARMLFKEGRPSTGENWAEKVSCEIAKRLAIPCAEYDLASYRDLHGVVTPTIVPTGGRLVLGNEILARVAKNYVAVGFRAKAHRLHLVLAVLGRPVIGLPLGYKPLLAITRAAHVFMGYLLLDALIGNQDRHHQNWGFVVHGGITLAPTFDHGSSLGRNEPDASRVRRLNTKDQKDSVAAYCERAMSGLYGPEAPLTTLVAFQKGTELYPDAAAYWLDRLGKVSVADMHQIVSEVPAALISQPAIQFAVKMLEINRARLLGI